jgi:hypothetical protein
MTNKTTATATATATPVNAGKKAKTVTKVQHTQRIIDRKLKTKTVGGDYAKLDRKVICQELQDKHEMTKGQASTYYHNELRKRAAGDTKIAKQLEGAAAHRQTLSEARKAKAAKKPAKKSTAAAA